MQEENRGPKTEMRGNEIKWSRLQPRNRADGWKGRVPAPCGSLSLTFQCLWPWGLFLTPPFPMDGREDRNHLAGETHHPTHPAPRSCWSPSRASWVSLSGWVSVLFLPVKTLTDMFITWIVVMVTHICAYVSTHEIIHIIWKLYIHASIKLEKSFDTFDLILHDFIKIINRKIYKP